MSLQNLYLLFVFPSVQETSVLVEVLHQEFDHVKHKIALSIADADQYLKSENFNMVIVYFNENWLNPNLLITFLTDYPKKIPVIFYNTAEMSEKTAVSLMKSGAKDVISFKSVERLPYIVLREQEERKYLLKGLEAEEKYRNIFHLSPLPKWIFDEATLKIVDVNEAALQMYGYTKEQFLNLTILDLRPVSEIPKLLQVRAKNYGTQKSFTDDTFIHVDKNGYKLNVQIHARSITFNNRPARIVVANNITRLKKSELLLHQTAAVGKIGGWEMSLSNQTLVLTAGAYNILEIPEDAHFAADDFVNMVQSKLAVKKLATVFKILRRLDSEMEFEVEIKTVSKQNKWLKIIARSDVLDKNTARFYGIVQDVSAINLSLSIVRQEKLNKRAIINSTNDFIWSIDKNYCLLTANHAFLTLFEKITGCLLKRGDNLIDVANILKHTPESKKAVAHQLLDGAKKNYDQALLGLQAITESYVELEPSGEGIWTETTFNPIKEGALIVGVAMFAKDITQQKTHIKLLQDNQAKLESLIANVPGVVYQMVVDQQGAFNFTYASAKGAEIFGLSTDANEWLLSDQLPEEDREAFWSSVHTAVQQKQNWEYTGKINVPEYGQKWFHAKSTLTQEKDLMIYNGIMLDITEVKKAHEHARQYSATLEELLFAMSHKLRKPVANILGIIALLSEDCLNDDEFKEMIKCLHLSGKELDGYIIDMNKQLYKSSEEISDL